MIFLDPRNDIAFKKIFGSDEHKNITISFLNSILELTGKKTIASIDFLNNEQVPQHIDKKENILDIFCVDQAGNRYIVELQIARVKEFDKRIVYYAAKAYSTQLGKGMDYFNIMPVVTVSVLDFVMFSTKKSYKSIYSLLDTKTHDDDLNELTFAFVELPKFNKKEHELETVEEKWIYFIKEIKKHTEIPTALRQNEFEEACQALNRMTWSEQALDIHDKEAIMASSYRSSIELAQEEGLEKGIEKGRDQRTIEVAHELLSCGVNIEIIAKSTGLLIDEIKQLSKYPNSKKL